MKAFVTLMAKVAGAAAVAAAASKAMARFEHKMLDGVEPRRKK